MQLTFLALILALFVYEVVALVRGAYGHLGETISEQIWAVTAKRPIIPFLFGMLMGHFFWRW